MTDERATPTALSVPTVVGIMGTDGETRRIDDKGRVTLPQSIRESLALDAGEEVTVELANGQVVIRPQVSREAFVERMEGCVNTETRREDTEPTREN